MVTRTNRATFGGDKALSAQISLVFSGMVVTSAEFGGDKAPPAQTFLIFSGMVVTSAGFGGEEHSVLGPLRRLLNRTFNVEGVTTKTVKTGRFTTKTVKIHSPPKSVCVLPRSLSWFCHHQ